MAIRRKFKVGDKVVTKAGKQAEIIAITEKGVNVCNLLEDRQTNKCYTYVSNVLQKLNSNE